MSGGRKATAFKESVMAIMNPMYAEMDHLRERMNIARSRDEYEYFRDRLRELERRASMSMFGYDEPRRVMLTPPPLTLAPEPVTPLSFLKSADKKLLLTGATT
jgi:hypothetical protein